MDKKEKEKKIVEILTRAKSEIESLGKEKLFFNAYLSRGENNDDHHLSMPIQEWLNYMIGAIG